MWLKEILFLSVVGVSTCVGLNSENNFELVEHCDYESVVLDEKVLNYEFLQKKSIAMDLGSLKQFEVVNTLDKRIKNYGEIIEAVFALDKCRLEYVDDYTVQEGKDILNQFSSTLTQKYVDDTHKLDLINKNLHYQVFIK